MGDETYTFNSDGSVTIPVDGKQVRYVKESDLLTVKSGKEKLESDFEAHKTRYNTDLAEANRIRNETHQQLLQSQAALEQLQKDHGDYDTLKTRVGELETELGSTKEIVTNYEKELADRIRHNLITYHGAKDDALNDKDLSQLRSVEEAAKIFGGKNGQPANYDSGEGGSGQSSEPATPIDRANAILADHDRRKGKTPA